MKMPTQHNIEEWEYLIFALGRAGRKRLYVEARDGDLLPRVRRWWVEVLMEDYIGPAFKPATWLFTREAAFAPLGRPSLSRLAFVSPLPTVTQPPIVIGGSRPVRYLGQG
jgi:hypothetical protein